MRDLRIGRNRTRPIRLHISLLVFLPPLAWLLDSGEQVGASVSFVDARWPGALDPGHFRAGAPLVDHRYPRCRRAVRQRRRPPTRPRVRRPMRRAPRRVDHPRDSRRPGQLPEPARGVRPEVLDRHRRPDHQPAARRRFRRRPPAVRSRGGGNRSGTRCWSRRTGRQPRRPGRRRVPGSPRSVARPRRRRLCPLSPERTGEWHGREPAGAGLRPDGE